MGFLETLTIVFIILKITGFITWSWWLVLLPEIIAFGIYLLMIIAWALISFMAWRGNKKFKNKFISSAWKHK